MSKKKSSSSAKKPATPQFSGSKIYYGDNLVGETLKQGNDIITRYFPDPAEMERQKIADARINQLLPTLGQTAPELAAQYDQASNDWRNQQTDKFTQEYNKTMRGLREDTGRRFGTLKSSTYFDRMEDVTKNVWNPGILDINRNASIMRQDLSDQDQARKLRELSALGGTLSAGDQEFLGKLQPAYQGSQMGNNYNNNLYNAQMQQYQLGLQQQAQQPKGGFMSNLLGSLF